jgi:hypothetical protein
MTLSADDSRAATIADYEKGQVARAWLRERSSLFVLAQVKEFVAQELTAHGFEVESTSFSENIEGEPPTRFSTTFAIVRNSGEDLDSQQHFDVSIVMTALTLPEHCGTVTIDIGFYGSLQRVDHRWKRPLLAGAQLPATAPLETWPLGSFAAVTQAYGERQVQHYEALGGENIRAVVAKMVASLSP